MRDLSASSVNSVNSVSIRNTTCGLRTLVAVLSLLSVTMIAAVNLAFAPLAHAHDAVIASSPEDGSTVTEFPSVIELTVSGNPKENFNTMAVSNKETGKIVAKGSPVIEQNVIRYDVPADVHPSPGVYVVGFQFTSSDGHATRGSISFTYAGDGSSEASSEESGEPQGNGSSPSTAEQQRTGDTQDGNSENHPAPDSQSNSESNTDSTSHTWLWIAIGIVVIIVLLLIIVLRRLGKSSQ